MLGRYRGFVFNIVCAFLFGSLASVKKKSLHMRNKKVLFVIGGGSLVCCSMVCILVVIIAVVFPSKKGGEQKLAEVTEIIPSELTLTATEVLEPTVSPSSTILPTPINTPSPEPTSAPGPTIMDVNLPQCILNNPIGTEALVTKVIDGDTIEVEVEGKLYKVRYIGMDTPELTDPQEDHAQQAASKNIELVFGNKVMMYRDVSEMDRFGRLLRYVMVQGVFVNQELVRTGFARATSYPPDTACDEAFIEVEKEARANLVGLWAVDTGTRSEEIPPQPTSATSQVVIKYIFYDGVVRQVESDEYAEITNQGDTAVQLDNWRLNAGAPGQDFIFPNFELQPGQTCRVYTNEVHPETCGFSFNSPQALWKNTGDCGYLYNATGEEVSKYCYEGN